jgi:hypothetical protein
MKPLNMLKKLADWFLPAGLSRWMMSTMNHYHTGAQRLPLSMKQNLAENVRFENIHHGERCFVLATGPSIKSQNLKKLRGEFSISVGDFYLHPDTAIIKPRYHCIAPYHAPFTMDAIGKRLAGLIERYAHPVDYFFGHNTYPISVYRYFSENPLMQLPGVHYIDYTSGVEIDEHNHQQKRIWDICRRPFLPRTVIYIAIQVAVYMGFSPIYLLGVDHDYIMDIHRVTNHHFYPEEQGIRDAEHLSQFNSERWFEEYYYRWKQFRLMRQYLEPLGIQIFNATKGGLLDVFPRVNFDELFI